MTAKKKTKAKAKNAKKVVGATARSTERLRVIHIYPELTPWVDSVSHETNRPKREVVNAAIEFAKENGFKLDRVIPGHVAAWLEKSGNRIA